MKLKDSISIHILEIYRSKRWNSRKTTFCYNTAEMADTEEVGVGKYQFTKKKRKPVDVCYKVGFETCRISLLLSKKFGYAPQPNCWQG